MVALGKDGLRIGSHHLKGQADRHYVAPVVSLSIGHARTGGHDPADLEPGLEESYSKL